MRRGVEALEPEVYASAAYYEKCHGLDVSKAFREVGGRRDQHNAGEAAPEPRGARKGAARRRLDLREAEHVRFYMFFIDFLKKTCEKRCRTGRFSLFERFSVGDVVRVKESSWSSRWRRPHLRTPGFVHGICGRVEAVLGCFENPEQLAFGGRAYSKSQPPGEPLKSCGRIHASEAPSEPLRLYRVRFEAKSIQDFEAGEAGQDQVTVEVYQHWLEPAEAVALEAQRKRQRPLTEGPADCKRHRHEGHEHEERLTVEQRAVDEERRG